MYIFIEKVITPQLHQIATVISILRYIVTNKVLNIDRCKITNLGIQYVQHEAYKFINLPIQVVKNHSIGPKNSALYHTNCNGSMENILSYIQKEPMNQLQIHCQSFFQTLVQVQNCIVWNLF